MRREIALFGCLALAASFVAGCNQGKGSGPTTGGVVKPKRTVMFRQGELSPRLVYVGGKPQHNFGKLSQEAVDHHTFQVTNEGPGELRIRLENTSCGCTSVKFANVHWKPKEDKTPPDDIVVIPVGDTLDVEMTWATEMKMGLFHTTARFESNDPREPVAEFVIDGEILPFVETTQSSINLTSARNTEPITTSFLVFSKIKEDLEIKEITTSNDKIKVEYEPAAEEVLTTMSAVRAYKCIVTVEPGAAIGKFSASIAVHTNCEQRPEIEIPISGTFTGDVILTADHLEFGHVRAGESTVQSVIVKVRSDEAVDVKVKRVVPDFLKPTVTRSESAKNRFMLKVEVPANAPGGPFRGGVELETSHPGCESVKIPITGTVALPLDPAARVTGP